MLPGWKHQFGQVQFGGGLPDEGAEGCTADGTFVSAGAVDDSGAAAAGAGGETSISADTGDGSGIGLRKDSSREGC